MIHVCARQGDLESLAGRGGLYIALVYVDWCPFSLISKSQIDALALRAPQIPIFKIAADNFTYLPEPFATASYPTLFVIVDGVVALNVPGLQTAECYSALSHQIAQAFPDGRAEIDNKRFQFDATLHIGGSRDRPIGKSRLVLSSDNDPGRAKTIFLDPILSALCLLLLTARAHNKDDELFVSGQKGVYYQSAVHDVKVFLRVHRHAQLKGLTDISDRPKNFVSRQISRINAEVSDTIGFHLVERIGRSYRVNARFRTQVSLDDYRF